MVRGDSTKRFIRNLYIPGLEGRGWREEVEGWRGWAVGGEGGGEEGWRG